MIYLGLLAALAAAALAQSPDPMRAAIERQRASIDLQRQSIRRQAASAGAWLGPWNPAPSSSCEPLPDTAVTPIIESAAKAQQIDSKLLRSVIAQESAFRPCAVSAKGAMGLMQLMPATIDRFEVRDPFDSQQSIDAGAKYLKELLGRYQGDLARALGAYNAGPTTVDEAGGIPDIPETRAYVNAILQRLGLNSIAPPQIPKPKPIEN